MLRFRPVLLETFCESARFQTACYSATNWIRVGQTQGRAKLHVRNQYAPPSKASCSNSSTPIGVPTFFISSPVRGSVERLLS